MCVIHGTTIEDNVLIGMGALTMNGSTVRTHAMLGAKSMLTERREVPARGLWLGAPGKVIREVTDAEIAEIRYSAEHYHELAESHRAAQG
jgi:carbonic anhydrase/acetyltransferase-like protein (isoleucine patch superfamily)